MMVSRDSTSKLNRKSCSKMIVDKGSIMPLMETRSKQHIIHNNNFLDNLLDMLTTHSKTTANNKDITCKIEYNNQEILILTIHIR